MSLAYIGLGSNLGDRVGHLSRAIKELDQSEGIMIRQVSAFYETDPVGVTDQPDFINAVAEIETTLTPRDLLKTTKTIEARQKRNRDVRWGPRTLDLDILLYDDQHIDEADLKLPHPEVRNRAFVLVPLAEIAPDLLVPGAKQVKQLLAELGEITGVSPHVGRVDN